MNSTLVLLSKANTSKAIPKQSQKTQNNSHSNGHSFSFISSVHSNRVTNQHAFEAKHNKINPLELSSIPRTQSPLFISSVNIKGHPQKQQQKINKNNRYSHWPFLYFISAFSQNNQSKNIQGHTQDNQHQFQE